MSEENLKSVNVADVFIRGDIVQRKVDDDAVIDLASSMGATGLHLPIRVRPLVKYVSGVKTDAWELVDGRHRLEAARLLGWGKIDANTTEIDDDGAEIAMIDANLNRKNLTPAEEAAFTARRKVLYERKFPGTQRTATLRQNAPSRNDCETVERFTLATAKATGKSERAVQMSSHIGEKLGDDALKLVGTSLDSVTELAALAKIKKRNEKAANDLINRAVAGENVSAKSEPKPAQPTSQEDEDEQRFWDFWASLKPATRRKILPQLKQMSA